MELLIFTVFLVFSAFVGLGILNARLKPKAGLKFRVGFIQLNALWLFGILLFGMFVRVGQNEVGIVYDPFNGGIQERTLGEGFNAKTIFQKVTTLQTTNRMKDISMWAQTRDSEAAEFQITIIYRLESTHAGFFYRKTGNGEISDRQLDSLISGSLSRATTVFDVYDILGEKLDEARTIFEDDLKEILFNEYRLTLVKVSFNDIDAGSEIESIIRQKSQAKQQIEIAQQEQLRVAVDAQTALIRAQNEATVIMIKAQAEAEAQVILNAVAVNAIRDMYFSQFGDGQDTSTPEVYGFLTIQEIVDVVKAQMYFDTWDGVLPEVITDGNGIIIGLN